MIIPGRLASPADLFVAVAGHRAIADPDAVTAAAARARRHILDRYPQRHVVVISALAEGADRLVLAPWLADPDVALVAMLPLPRTEYITDFRSDVSRAEFDRLIARAAHVIELPGYRADGAAYEEVGRALVAAADVLVAVWDGEPPRGPGGTGAVVAESRKRNQPLAWIKVNGAAPGSVDLILEGSNAGVEPWAVA